MLTEILVTEGQTVAVQTVVATIETEAGAVAAAPAPAPAPATPAAAPKPPAPAAAPTVAAAAAAPAAAPRPSPAPSRPAPEVAATSRNGAANGGESAEERLRRRSTPLVRKMAAEHNLDLSAIPGSGLAGRVTKNDILGYLETGTAQTAAPAPAGPPAARAQPRVRSAGTRPGTARPGRRALAGRPSRALVPIRKLTAEHMVMSRRVSPHVNTIFEIDYTRVAQIRARKKKEYADRGVNLTYLAFIAKAAADALRTHPSLNSAVSGESTVFRRDINLGIAVALDWGLIVPVIKHADELSLLGLARAIGELGERARSKKLSPDDVQRGDVHRSPTLACSARSSGRRSSTSPRPRSCAWGRSRSSRPSSPWTAPIRSPCVPRACCRSRSITGSWTAPTRTGSWPM